MRPGLPDETVARLKRALLPIKAPEHAALLKQIYDIDGFIEAYDATTSRCATPCSS